MIDRNSTYVAFHANPAKEPEVTDVHILALLKSWEVRADGALTLTDGREKGEARRAVRMREFTERHLRMRLDGAKHMVLSLRGKFRHSRNSSALLFMTWCSVIHSRTQVLISCFSPNTYSKA
jgi:hypothetical protein